MGDNLVPNMERCAAQSKHLMLIRKLGASKCLIQGTLRSLKELMKATVVNRFWMEATGKT
jgi:hypothetical protein